MRFLGAFFLFCYFGALPVIAIEKKADPKIGISEYYESIGNNWHDIDLAFNTVEQDFEIPNQSELVYFSRPEFSEAYKRKAGSDDEPYEDCFKTVVAHLSVRKSPDNSKYKIRELALDAAANASYASVLFNANPAEQKDLPPGAGGTLVISEKLFVEKVIPDGKTCNPKALFDYLEKAKIHLNSEESFPVGDTGYKKIDFDDKANVVKSELLPHGTRREFGRIKCAANKAELQSFIVERISQIKSPDEGQVKGLVRDLAECRRARPEVYQEVLPCFDPYKYLLPSSLLPPNQASKHDLGMAIPDADYYSGKGMRNPGVMSIPASLQPGSPLAEAIHGLKPIDEILRIQDSINEENRKKGIDEKVSVFRNISAFKGMDLGDIEKFYNGQMYPLKSDSPEYKKLAEQRAAHLNDFGLGRIVVFIERTNAQSGKEAQVFQMSYPEKLNEISVSKSENLFLMSQIGIELDRANHSSGVPHVVRLGDQRKIFTNGKHSGYERVTTSDSCFKCHSQDSPVWLLGAHPDTDKYLTEQEKTNLSHFNSQVKRYQREGIFLDASPFQGLDLPVLGDAHPQREEILSALIGEEEDMATFSKKPTSINREAITRTMSSCVDCHDKTNGKYKALSFADAGLTPSQGDKSTEHSAIQAWLHKMSPRDVKLNPLETYIVAKAMQAESKGDSFNTISPSGDTSTNVQITGSMGTWYMDLFINKNACLKEYLVGAPKPEDLNKHIKIDI